MSEHSFVAGETVPLTKILAQKADEALMDGDRDRVMEFVARIYDLLDWQVAWAWQAKPERATRRRPRLRTSPVH